MDKAHIAAVMEQIKAGVDLAREQGVDCSYPSFVDFASESTTVRVHFEPKKKANTAP